MGRREEFDRGLERTKTENLSKNGPQIRSPLFFVVVRAILYTLVCAVVVVEVVEVVGVVVQRHLLLTPTLYYICLRLLCSDSQIY